MFGAKDQVNIQSIAVLNNLLLLFATIKAIFSTLRNNMFFAIMELPSTKDVLIFLYLIFCSNK